MLNRAFIIEWIGAEICLLRQDYERAGERLTDSDIRAYNAEGWTVEARLPGSEYVDTRDFTRLEGIVLSESELAQAIG